MTESAAAGTTAQPERSIAIVGLACRYPDADDAPSLLNTVLTGRRAFRQIPPVRLDLADYHNPDPHQRDATYCTRAALLEGWRFDRAAFGISKPEFASADPARWLALETTAGALAAAGFPGGTGLPAGRAGVYIGHVAARDGTPSTALRLRWPYARRALADALKASQVPAQIGQQVLAAAAARYLAPFPPVTGQTLAGSSGGAIATAICGQFGLRGGGHTVDAEGASSLAAIASACLALSAGELDLAVAGGVDLNIEPFDLVTLAKAGALARDAMLIYDEAPTGFLPGEGCGIVLLMRAADARASNLPVYAEIVGWGQASGGPAPAGPVRPADRQAAQTDTRLLAMRRAHEMADVDPADIQLVEGSGSGIGTADQAELAALGVLRSGARSKAAFGAVTANIGHTRAAAGAAGLIKAALAMANGVLPPATGVRTPHPLLREGRASLRLLTAPEPWPTGPRRASVGAAGQDGLAVHLVLRSESSPARAPRPAKNSAEIALRAHTRQAEPGHCFAYLLAAADREAMAELLSVIERRAPWLSDAELQDLAVHLSREAAGVRQQGQYEIRVGLTASGQQDLATLAGDARALLATLAHGSLSTRPGIYAAARLVGSERPRVAAVIASQHQDLSGLPQRQLTRMLDILRMLDKLGVEVSAAIGHGMGELAGLVWAGCATEADARTLLALRAAALTAAPSAAPGEVGNLITKLGSFAFRPPRRRLISGCTGSEVAGAAAIIEALCAELFEARLAASGGESRGFLASAVTEAVQSAALIVQTGQEPDVAAVLTRLAGGSSGSEGDESVPVAVSVNGDPADDSALAPAAAALFAAGALCRPQVLYADRPSRPIDLWREPVFISHPCQRLPGGEARPRARLAWPESVPAEPTQADSVRPEPAPADSVPPEPEPADSVRPEPAPADSVPPEPEPADSGQAASSPSDGPLRLAGSGDIAVPTSITPWFRCFTEQTQEPGSPVPVGDDQPWRVYTGGCGPLGQKVREIFRHDPAAGRTLAVLGPLDEAATREALVLAVKDAIGTGSLVAIGDGPALAGVWSTLHAEHPSVGITAVRASLTPAGLAAARCIAATRPGEFRELVIASDGAISEPVMRALPQLGGGDFPFGHDDVVVITSLSGAAGLALARVLACSGAAVAIVGRARRAHDQGVVAGLEELRRAGSRVCYELVTLADHRAVSAAVRRVEARFGCVTAIGHAAGPVQQGAVAALDVAAVHQLVRDHTAPLDQVASAVRAVARSSGVRSGRLRLIATFGSVTGRYGLAGEGFGALVTGAVAERCERTAAASPGCQALHVDWPVWSGHDLGERADLADAMARRGYTAMPVSDGSRLLLKTLGTKDLPRRIALHGRVGVPAPPQIAAGSKPALGGGPQRFLERVIAHYPGVELVTEATLSLRADPYLADYCPDGVPVLPPTMALEAMAQAASVLADAPVRHARQITAGTPVVLPAASPSSGAVLRIYARRDGHDIAVRIRGDSNDFADDRCNAVFSARGDALAINGLAADGVAAGEVAAGVESEVLARSLYGPLLFQAGRFDRLRSVRLTGLGSAEGIAATVDELRWFGPVPPPAVPPPRAGTRQPELVLGSAALSDAVLQLIQACMPSRRLAFDGCDAITFSDSVCSSALPDGVVAIRLACQPTARSEPGGNGHASAAQAKAAWPVPVPRSEAGGLFDATPLSTWHAQVVDSSGRAAMIWTGLRMRESAPLEPQGLSGRAATLAASRSS